MNIIGRKDIIENNWWKILWFLKRDHWKDLYIFCL
jgi:hypothetical protein